MSRIVNKNFFLTLALPFINICFSFLCNFTKKNHIILLDFTVDYSEKKCYN
jgi:hypothetical protein